MHRRAWIVVCLIVLSLMAAQAQAPSSARDIKLVGDRFKPLKWDEMTSAQKTMMEHLFAGERRGAGGPFNVLLRSPEMGDLAQQFGVDQLADPLVRSRCIVGNDGQIALLLPHDLVNDPLWRADAQEAPDHKTRTVGDHPNRLIEGDCAHIGVKSSRMIAIARSTLHRRAMPRLESELPSQSFQ